MREFIKCVLLEVIQKDFKIDSPLKLEILIPQEQYGDFSTNISFQISKILKISPYDVASKIAAYINAKKLDSFEQVEPTKNGFVNFRLSHKALISYISLIIKEDDKYGKSSFGAGKKILIEFVSANPTGPLHVGHGRWAVIGDDIANLFEAIGYDVEREYYVNDAGNQINKFKESVTARVEGKETPEGGYGGAYVTDIASHFTKNKLDLSQELIPYVLSEQTRVLFKMGVKFDSFFSEKKLHESGLVNNAINLLKEKNKTEVRDGALWFLSTLYGDDKDRVMIRENGETTYFAADIAYHIDKFNRGYDKIINIWGADHHGYVARVKAAIEALDFDSSKFEVVIGQLVSLVKGNEPIRMSKRTGEMITLEEVIDEVGADATRFFMSMASVNSHLTFDMALAKEKAPINPVFYIQYAYARICSVINEYESKGFAINQNADLSGLSDESERRLVRALIELPNEILVSATNMEPHTVIEYVKNIASLFHTFYHKCRVISEDAKLTESRVLLLLATRIVLGNVLKLLKVSTPQRM